MEFLIGIAHRRIEFLLCREFLIACGDRLRGEAADDNGGPAAGKVLMELLRPAHRRTSRKSIQGPGKEGPALVQQSDYRNFDNEFIVILVNNRRMR